MCEEIMYGFLTKIHNFITGNHSLTDTNNTRSIGITLIDFPLNLCEDTMLENSLVHTRVMVHVNNFDKYFTMLDKNKIVMCDQETHDDITKYFDAFHSRTNIVQMLQTKYEECLEKLTAVLNERTKLIEKFNECTVVVNTHKIYTFRELIDLPFDDCDPIYVHHSFFEDACTARLEMFYHTINFSKNTEKIIDLETCLLLLRKVLAHVLVDHTCMIVDETPQCLQYVKQENTKREQRKNIRKALRCC